MPRAFAEGCHRLRNSGVNPRQKSRNGDSDNIEIAIIEISSIESGAMFETLVLGQMMRAYANAGRAADIYFYQDHYGNEVDFVIPEGEKLRLFECKWLETPPSQVKAFDEIAKLAGESNIVSRSVVTPFRRARFLRDRRLHIQDC